jgi:hypothetical protein
VPPAACSLERAAPRRQPDVRSKLRSACEIIARRRRGNKKLRHWFHCLMRDQAGLKSMSFAPAARPREAGLQSAAGPLNRACERFG